MCNITELKNLKGGSHLELVTKNIHMNKLKCKSSLQMTLDDDFNVPDTRPDVSKLIKTGGELKFNEQKMMNGKLYINGNLHFTVLYVSDESERPIQSIRGQIPFNEVMNLTEDCNQENAHVKYDIEDMSVNIINSRKLSLKALISLSLAVESVYDEEGAVDVDGDNDVHTLTKMIDITNMAVNKRDSYRFRDEIVLPNDKHIISEILFSDIELKNVDIRLLTDKFTIKGELLVFILYLGEGEGHPIEYYETELPFSSTIDCNGSSEDMTPDITLSLLDKNLEIKPDSDGEERVVDVETVLEVNIKIYEETQMEILKDIYSPTRDITPIYKDVCYENLLMRNSNKARINERVRIDSNHPRILQICHGSGDVKVDEITPIENGLRVDGVLNMNILYVTSEDSAPMQSINSFIPFSQLIEVKDLKPNSLYDIKPSLEQINIIMLDTQEIEVKASVVFNVIVFDQLEESFLIDYNEAPLDMDKLQAMPGMIGYVVKPGDSLWSIAKAYHTTVDTIKEINDLESDIIHPGDHLLIVKEVTPVFR